MVKIQTIAATKEMEGVSAVQLNEEQTFLSGKFGGTCYAKEGYETMKSQPVEKAMKRAESTAMRGHHSVFQHSMINMEIVCPKMIAMLLNSIGVSNTSEKSARYTTMKPETQKELELYEKWHSIFTEEIKRQYGERISDKEADKLAYENARYMISVFSETSMVYSLPFRNIFYVLDWIRGMQKTLSTLEGAFNKRLKDELDSLYEALLGVVGKENFHDNKNEYFRFLPVQATGAYDYNREYYGDVYTAELKATFAQIAQQQRHRTTRVKINFGGDDAEEFGFYVPELIRGSEYEESWKTDMRSVKSVYPQGILVSVTEQGLFEDFALKCKERMCGRAQLEIMRCTQRLVEKFAQNQENLSEANQKRLSNLLEQGKPCARCSYSDFTCKEGCTWGKKEALLRKI